MEARLTAIRNFAAEKMNQDHTGHNMDHIQRVVHLAANILETEPTANQSIVLAASYLHDTIDDKLVVDVTTALEELQQFLALHYNHDEVAHIVHIIQNMSYSKSLGNQGTELTLEGQIVQDADRLDALGALGILRTAYFGGSQGHPIYDPEIKPISYQNKVDYRKGSTVINHFYEKLLLLADTMNTDYAKEEGQRRTQFMHNFLAEFFLEWQD